MRRTGYAQHIHRTFNHIDIHYAGILVNGIIARVLTDAYHIHMRAYPCAHAGASRQWIGSVSNIF